MIKKMFLVFLIFLFLIVFYLILILELLTKTPEKRLSVSDALEHPFFRNHVSSKLTEIRKVKKKCDKFIFDVFTTSDITYSYKESAVSSK